MSSTTIYSNYTVSMQKINGNWSTARDSASADEIPGDFQAKVEKDGSNNYVVKRLFVFFDTSALPDNATISATNLVCYGSRDNSGNANSLYITQSNVAANSNLQVSDFSAVTTNVLRNISYTDFAASNGDGWRTIALTDTSFISKTGLTKMVWRQANDYANSAPGSTWNTYQIYGAADATYKPYLTITYTTPPIVTTGAVTALQPISATLAGNVTDAGGGTVSTRGVCWNTSTNPTTSNSKTATTGTTGAFTVGATGLLPGTLYYCRAYVTTENSTTYGDNVTFRTPGGAILFNLL